MTRIQKLMGITLVALVVGGGIGVAGHAAKPPIASAKIADGSRHACVEGTFEWRWNVPFASTCDAGQD